MKMKKTSISILVAASLGLSGAAYAQFDVDLGGGAGVIAGQGVETSVVGAIGSFPQSSFVSNNPQNTVGATTVQVNADTVGPTEIKYNVPDVATNQGGVNLIKTGANSTGGGTTTFGATADGGQTSTAFNNNTASLSGTSGTTGGEGVAFGADNDVEGDKFIRAAGAGASLSGDLGWMEDMELVAQATGDTYNTLDLGTQNGGFSVGLADADVQQTAVSHMDIDGFSYQTNGFNFGPL